MTTNSTTPQCPRCSGLMVLRVATKGPSKGNKFYGCKRFPLCKATVPYKDTATERFVKQTAEIAAAKSPPSPPKETIPLTDRQKEELQRLRDRLLNLSSRNRSIRLNRLDAKWSFDLSSLNRFDPELSNEIIAHCLKKDSAIPILPKMTTENAEDWQALSKKLVALHRSVTDLQKEKGLYDLYLGLPFLVGKAPGTELLVQAPIILIPVQLERQTPKKGAQMWTLTPNRKVPIAFNKTLFYAIAKASGFTVNPKLFEEDIPEEIYGETSITSWAQKILETYGIPNRTAPEAHDREIDPVQEFLMKEIPATVPTDGFEIRQHAVLGHFPQSNSSIQKDYDEFLISDQEKLDPILCFLDGRMDQLDWESEDVQEDGVGSATTSLADEFDDSESQELIESRPEAENFFLLPSDSSQDQILLELSKPSTPGLVVWGPPGTGKSQTIVNLIGDALAKGKSVLLVSQKRAALDVVFDRLAGKKLDSLVGLVHDTREDRRALYSKIERNLEEAATASRISSADPVDPSGEIERVTERLRSIQAALSDTSFGLPLSAIYHRLGGNREGILSEIPTTWTKKSINDLPQIVSLFREFQSWPRKTRIEAKYKRTSFSTVDNDTRERIASGIRDLFEDRRLRDAASVLTHPKIQSTSHLTPANNLPDLAVYSATLRHLVSYKGWTRFFRPSFWRLRKEAQIIEERARQFCETKASTAKIWAGVGFLSEHATDICLQIRNGQVPDDQLRIVLPLFEEDFLDLKGRDRALDAIPEELRPIALRFEAAQDQTDWGTIVERSVLSLWASSLERKHPVLSDVATGQSEKLRERLRQLLDQKVAYSVHVIRRKYMSALAAPENRPFVKELMAEVTKSRNIPPIRKLNEKFQERTAFKKTVPVWLVSPESVSDAFPLQRGLFDLVIFDEASQCTVEDGLPAVYRGKQVVIAGDEKQLPPNRLFESSIDDDGVAIEEEDSLMGGGTSASKEDSLLTLAKKTQKYKSSMLQWHYRSLHQELVSFSNEKFYHGRIRIAPNVVPFIKGNVPAIKWHSVTGFWENRANLEEAKLILRRIRDLMSEDKQPTVGVITFNINQRELIRDLLDQAKIDDPEFAEMLAKDQERPVDSQLFIKNIENVQGDEREIILFSVAYAPSHPGGRVNQSFGSLSQKGGENRLNVAVTRAIKGIEIVCSINPEDLDASQSKNEGPKSLKNYLRFAKAVSESEIRQVEAVLREINPNLDSKGNGAVNFTESPFETEVLEALEQLGYEVHTQVGQSGFRIDMAVVHPENRGRYLLGIECDGATYHSHASARERDVFRQRFLELRGWSIHRIWSSKWWTNRSQEIQKVRSAIDQARLKNGSGLAESPISTPSKPAIEPPREVKKEPNLDVRAPQADQSEGALPITPDLYRNLIAWNAASKKMTNGHERNLLGRLETAAYFMTKGRTVEDSIMKGAREAVDRAIYLGFDPKKAYNS